MSDATVSIARGNDPYTITRQALLRINPTPVSGRGILLVPRAGELPNRPATRRGNTHPRVIEAAIDWFNENHASSVAVALSPALGVSTEKACLASLSGICQKKDVALINIDHHPTIWLDIFDGGSLDRILTTELLVDHDFIVSMPIMSTSRESGVALSLENLTGLVARHHKLYVHPRIHTHEPGRNLYRERSIADLARVLYPDMAIIDGTPGPVGDEPDKAPPENTGLVVAGNDALCTDQITCELMEIDPADIHHLRMVGRQRPVPESWITTPPNWKSWITPFEQSDPVSAPPDILVDIFNHNGCTSCQNALYQFLEHHYPTVASGQERPRFSMGPDGPQYPADTFYVGNCAASRDADHSGHHCNGCPPQAQQIWDKFKRLRRHGKASSGS
jgi:uncharacterized protein (DUF362 family)